MAIFGPFIEEFAMTFSTKLLAAAFGAALVLSFASVAATTTASGAVSATVSTQYALNPQPLPPFVDPDHDDFFDLG